MFSLYVNNDTCCIYRFYRYRSHVRITFELMNEQERFLFRKVEEYKACITEQTIYKSGGEIRVWDTPRCLADGAILVDILTEPIEAIAIEEQLECNGTGLQRIKIRYGDAREGWVLDDAVEK